MSFDTYGKMYADFDTNGKYTLIMTHNKKSKAFDICIC